MDLLDCQSRSRCPTCHHFNALSGCKLLADLAAWESTVTAAPQVPAIPVLFWADTRAAADA